jgi:hypothetical protein
MKKILPRQRLATHSEEARFLARLEAVLEVTNGHLVKLRSDKYVLRMMTIRAHNVKAHTRQAHQKAYLAKKQP